MGKLRALFVEFFKLKQTFLLVLSGALSYLIAEGRGFDILVLGTLTLSIYLTVAGTTGLNMVLDRDIDSVMFRTRNRPIPDGRMSTREATLYSVASLAAGLALASSINAYVLSAGILGLVVDILLYTYLLKRRTWLSVVIGGIAGGAPALGGYMAAPGSSLVDGSIFMLIVSLWAMVHIWYISVYYKEDYEKARIPMLPLVKGERTTAAFSLVSTAAIILLFALAFVRGVLGVATMACVAAMSAYLIKGILDFHREPSNRALARRVYKFLNMYLGLSLTLGFIEKLLA